MLKKKRIYIAILLFSILISLFVSKIVQSDVDCTEYPEDPSCAVDCQTNPTDPSCVSCETDPTQPICDVCLDMPGIQTDPAECLDCTGDTPPAGCDFCPDMEGIQTDPFDCDVCPDQDGVQTDPLECDYCPDIDGIQNDPAACYLCVPEESPDQCHIEYCADQEANNTSDAIACEATNQDAVQNHGYSCYGVFTDPPCSYDPVSYCPPTTQAQCENNNPGRTCVLGSNCSQLCSWATVVKVTCYSGAQHFAPISGNYFYIPPQVCVAPTVFSQQVIDALTTAFCSSLVPPDVECTTPDCEEYDWCPDIEGIQTDPLDCEETDYCPNIPGIQTDPAECTDYCKNIDGVQVMSSMYSLDEDNNCLCYGIACGPDLCPNIPSIQLTVPEGYELDTSGDCVCSGEFCCSNGTSYCEDSNQCIPDTDICTTDKCNNIDGVQLTVPSGYVTNGAGGCVCDDVSCSTDDECLNITGIQTTVPIGFTQDAEKNCECIGNSCATDKCSNIDGIQISVPSGYSLNGTTCTCVNSSCLMCTGDTCTSDKCSNITGIQIEVPIGYSLSGDGQCVCSEQNCSSDLCPNISDIQLSVPSGYAVNELGQCVCTGSGCNVDQCNNITDIQVEVPMGYTRDIYGTCTCTGQNCSSDLCPNISDIQLSVPSGYVIDELGQCVCTGYNCGADQCTNIEGIQLDIPSGYSKNELNQCICTSLNCTIPVNGICGSLNGTQTDSKDNVYGLSACSSGTVSTVVTTGGQYTWNCLGSGGGVDSLQCSATINCGDTKYYCDQTESCLVYGATCNKVVEPPGKNTIIGGTNGTVLLKNALKVTTLIKAGESCTVSWGSGSAIIERYNSQTHCALYNQDYKLASFDPETVGSTTSVTVNRGTNISTTNTSLTESNIKKDTVYNLKCWQGAETVQTVYEESVGSCRLNVRQTEYN